MNLFKILDFQFHFSIKQFNQKAKFRNYSESRERHELEHAIRTRFADTSKLNNEREKSKNPDILGHSTFVGIVGGATSLLFAGPILATTIGASVGVGLYKLARAARRESRSDKLVRFGTSNNTRWTILHQD